MKFDAVIIGGGLSSLVCGIKLSEAGKKTLVVSAGQNALNFSSGTFGLLSRDAEGNFAPDPFAAMEALPEEHPYKKIGIEKVKAYADSTGDFFARCGISLHGNSEANSFRVSPTGTLMPCWMGMNDATLLAEGEKIGSKALIINFDGFLDFNTSLLAEGLESRGTNCRIEAVKIPEVEYLRTSPTEMRSVNIARVLENEDVLEKFISGVNNLLVDEDVVVLPQVFGLKKSVCLARIRKDIHVKVAFLGTMTPSVPGIRTQMLLRKAFEKNGTFLMGDKVIKSEIEDGKVKAIYTENLGDDRIEADEFILATGGIFGLGLETTIEKVVEPVFGLDVTCPESRTDWYDPSFFNKQAFSAFGVSTDKDFRGIKDGKAISNLSVIGAQAGGANPLAEGSGAGIAIMTAMSVAERIIG